MRLSNYYNINTSATPLVVMDLRVHLCNILNRVEEAQHRSREDETLLKTWMQASWATLINRPLPFMRNRSPNGYQVIFVDDYKAQMKHGLNYWRNEYCMMHGLPTYKGNRGIGDDSKPEVYWSIYRALTSYLEGSNIPIFREEGMEADDIAGTIHRMVSAGATPDRHVFYWSIDGDWLQLVDDATNQVFHGTLFGQDMMTETEVLQFYLKRKTPISSPKDIPFIKSLTGDEGDNLPPGSPVELFDLIDPPVKPSKALEKEIMGYLSKPVSNVSEGHYNQALRFINTFQ